MTSSFKIVLLLAAGYSPYATVEFIKSIISDLGRCLHASNFLNLPLRGHWSILPLCP